MLLINASNAGWMSKAASGSFCKGEKNLFWSLSEGLMGEKVSGKGSDRFCTVRGKKMSGVKSLSKLSKEIETSPSALQTPDKESETPLYLFSSHTWIPFYAFCQLLILPGACRRGQSSTKRNAATLGLHVQLSVLQDPGKTTCILNTPGITEDLNLKVEVITWMIFKQKSKDQEINLLLEMKGIIDEHVTESQTGLG